ncbi:MAG: hypothetical protein OXC10_07160 [Rhodospirillaceae bacterium]|nr:hypothetical protein [Rhodospirillaceae bacterium]
MPAALPAQMTVRECAEAVIAAQRRHGAGPAALLAAVGRPIAALLERDDLREQGIPRQGNNVAWSQYLYFDGDLSFLLFEVPEGGSVPPHDHGVWELFAVYRGRMRHTVYRRTDDGAVAGYAKLAATDDRVMRAGESAIVAPPADIHGFRALDGDAMGLTVVSGKYKPDRHYYDPDKDSYVVKRTANLR